MKVPFQRLFSIPAFEGLRVMRLYIGNNPGLQIEEIIQLIKTVEADASSFDLEASECLHGIIKYDGDMSGVECYRHFIHEIIIYCRPVWAKFMAHGRARFFKKLTRDDRSLFWQAGLLNNPPSDVVVKWWDEITGQVRLIHSAEKMEQARAAEKQTLDRERKRLQGLSIKNEPIWTAIEDNHAGYDVLSYEKGAFGLVNKLIEVKSTIASPLRFYISRNEWEQAVKSGDAYHFHIWDMKQKPPVLHERTMGEVKPHIPKDNGKGKWADALIPLNII